MTESTLIAEIVTFRTVGSAPDDTVVRAAGALAPFLAGCDGFVSRALSRDKGGTWTDHVLWTRLDLAEAAAGRMMHEPAAAAFLALIDMETVRMTHAPVLVAQVAA
jgi:hypothetical protein